jgi:REP element-mobilizing transposase RayT
MPRANRYIHAGCAYHLTHRCHDRHFLLRFARIGRSTDAGCATHSGCATWRC